jgi:chromosome transmission fidelity protein 4
MTEQQQHYSIPFPKNEEEDLPLNLVALPPLYGTTNTNDTSNNLLRDDMNNDVVDILAYGGENGHIYLLPSYTYSQQGAGKDSNDTTTNSTANNNNTNNGSDDMTQPKKGSSITNKPILLYEYNDIVRSLTISNDGLRIIVGFNYGDSKVFSFDEFVQGGEGAGEGGGEGRKVHVDKLGRVHHPFVNIKKVNEAIGEMEGKDGDDDVNNAGDKSDEEEEDGGFFTQSQGYDDDEDNDDSSSTPSIKEFKGPRFDAAIRHMAFDPRSSSTSKQYYVAMVSESSATPLRVVNVYDEDSVEKQVFLEEEGCDYHMGSGVKSVAYSNIDGGSGGGGNKKVWLTTLSMEGKINLWDVSSPLTLPDNWSHVHSDYVQVTPKDMGFSADAGDKACHLVWGSIGGGEKKDVLLVPGKVDVQVRVIPGGNSSDEDILTCFKKQQFLMALEEGHKDNIVAMAFEPVANDDDQSRRRVVTAARDGKLLLWEMTLDNDGSDEDTNSVSGSLVKELTMARAISETKGIPVITSIVWVGDVLYVANADGEISVVSVSAQMLAVNAEEEESGEKVGVESDVEDALEGDGGLLSGGDVDDKVKASSRVLEDDEDDEDGDINDAAVAESTDKDSGASKFIDDEAEAEDDDDVAASLNVEKDTAGQTAGGEDDDDKTEPMADDDVDFGNHDDPMDFGDSGDDHLRATSNYSLPPLQPAFAPSSTPIGDSRRILCWNHMGVLTLRPDVDNQGNNLVDISFHDNSGLAGGRRPITFTDNVGFIVGTLGDDGGLFASDLMEDEDEDDEFDEDGLTAGLSEATRKAVKRARKKLNGNDSAKGSSVYFHRFETFGKPSDKDWVYALPDGERVLGCATGKGWCGVMTR